MENEINSYCGVGKIQFGMEESQIYDWGIGLYVPTLKAGEDEEVEGVIAFVKDYYN